MIKIPSFGHMLCHTAHTQQSGQGQHCLQLCIIIMHFSVARLLCLHEMVFSVMVFGVQILFLELNHRRETHSV